MKSDNFDHEVEVKLNLTSNHPPSSVRACVCVCVYAAAVAAVWGCCSLVEIWCTEEEISSRMKKRRREEKRGIWRKIFEKNGETNKKTKRCKMPKIQREREREREVAIETCRQTTLFLVFARLIRRTPMPWRTNFMEVSRLSSTAG